MPSLNKKNMKGKDNDFLKIRMKTFIKAKLKIIKIYKYKVTANIVEYHIISKLILRKIIIPKCMMIRQFLYAKKYVKNSICLKWA